MWLPAQASQASCLRKNGGIEGDYDQEGLGWPPRELALRFVLPEHQSTTIPLFSVKLGATRKKGRKQQERKGYHSWLLAHKGRLQTENKLPQPRAFAKKGGTAGDGDREILGWPPRELALLFVLPNTNPQQSHLSSIKLGVERKKGRKQHERKRDIKRIYWLTGGRLKQRTSFPTPVPSQKGGQLQGTIIEKY